MAREFKVQVFSDGQLVTKGETYNHDTSLALSLDHHAAEGWEIEQFKFNTTATVSGLKNTVLVVYSRETPTESTSFTAM
jgi:hypothetical protein